MKWSVGKMLSKRAVLTPDKTAIYFEDRPIAYQVLNQEANRLADLFKAKGLRKGDRIAVDLMNGFVYMVDRAKDMYRSGAENVFPAEVESILIDHPKIDAVAIIGVPDEKWGETGKAYIQCKPGEWITIEEVHGFLSGNVARYKYPTLMETVDALPTTVWGKIKKAELKQRHLKNSDLKMSNSYRRYNSHRYG